MIDEDMANDIIAAGITEVEVRTILRCLAKRGVCVHCYGADLAHGTPVAIGEAVGVIAAQSIGEPGTQLTMRTFHTGGVAGSDITQGLPRVEELFEARKPKKVATASEIAGIVSISESKKTRNVTVTDTTTQAVATYAIPFGTRVIVAEGDYVVKGQPLTEGNMSLADITRINGVDAAYDYIIKEIQKVYRIQSVEINDKHIEVIARQMTRKCRVEESGDTELLSGSVIDRTEFDAANDSIKARMAAGEAHLRHATCAPVLLGITKASLQTESFLSAASFQETTKVLTEAAIAGKVDHLLGLKENVIIGKLIPAGTGMKRYNDIIVERAPVAEVFS